MNVSAFACPHPFQVSQIEEEEEEGNIYHPYLEDWNSCFACIRDLIDKTVIRGELMLDAKDNKIKINVTGTMKKATEKLHSELKNKKIEEKAKLHKKNREKEEKQERENYANKRKRTEDQNGKGKIGKGRSYEISTYFSNTNAGGEISPYAEVTSSPPPLMGISVIF